MIKNYIDRATVSVELETACRFCGKPWMGGYDYSGNSASILGAEDRFANRLAELGWKELDTDDLVGLACPACAREQLGNPSAKEV